MDIGEIQHGRVTLLCFKERLCRCIEVFSQPPERHESGDFKEEAKVFKGGSVCGVASCYGGGRNLTKTQADGRL